MNESVNKNVENNSSTKISANEVDNEKFWTELKSQLNSIKEMEAKDKALEDYNNNWTLIDEKISQFRVDWKIDVKELNELKKIAENEINELKKIAGNEIKLFDKEDRQNILAHRILIETINDFIKTGDLTNFSDFKSKLESNYSFAKIHLAKEWFHTKDYLKSLNPFSKEKWAIWKAYDSYNQINNNLEEFTKYSN